MSEMKPCPFCAGVDTHDPVHGSTFRIVCSTCGAGTDMYETPAQVIGAWNRRDTTAFRALVERVCDPANDQGYVTSAWERARIRAALLAAL